MRAAMERLPCSRDFECWDAYLAAALPLVKARTDALSIMCVRRARFASYMRRDQELDRIYKNICGTSTKEERSARAASEPDACSSPTLVAFGAASVPPARASFARYACSTGFGYAPAPQGRLRHRLAKVHGAKVVLMDEYKTSRTCSCCGSELEKVFKSQAAAEKCASQKTEALQRRAKRKADQSMAAGRPAPETPHRLLFPPRPERLIYGVLLCRNCGSRDGRPLFWHRDVNAARNILAVYLCPPPPRSGQPR